MSRSSSQPVGLAPDSELSRRPGVGLACVWVPDIGGEELDEPLARVMGGRKERGQRQLRFGDDLWLNPVSLPILPAVPKPQDIDRRVRKLIAQLIVADDHAPHIARREFFELHA